MGEFVDAIPQDRDGLAAGRHGPDVQLVLDAIHESATVAREMAIER